MLMNRLKLSSKLESGAGEADGDIDESAGGPIVFKPANKAGVLTTTIEVPGKKATVTA
jgi:hypothetical protein